jgi:biotin synthase-like enzyme
MKFSMEKGPIRPPSEAKSLLLRLARNCPWNRCAFCHTYRGSRFEFRSMDEIRGDILIARAIADRIGALRKRHGCDGRITQTLVDELCAEREFTEESIRSVAAWHYNGGESVFLQDADAMVLKSAELLEVISSIRDNFPNVRQITTYCRSRTAAGKSAEELRSLHDAGLTRIHIGLESGCDQVLEFMAKGATAAEHVTAGRRIVEAGLSLCVYVMPGLGGRRWTREHAQETAEVINRINPDFIRLMSLHVVAGTDLSARMEEGLFEPLGDEAMIEEIGRLIGGLDGISSTIVSDHILNLLEELEGKLPQDKAGLLETIDRFFALSAEERLVFRLGRRKGIYRRLDDLSYRGTFLWLKGIVDQYATADPGQLEADLAEAMNSYI